jgi:hypothetical protein
MYGQLEVIHRPGMPAAAAAPTRQQQQQNALLQKHAALQQQVSDLRRDVVIA